MHVKFFAAIVSSLLLSALVFNGCASVQSSMNPSMQLMGMQTSSGLKEVNPLVAGRLISETPRNQSIPSQLGKPDVHSKAKTSTLEMLTREEIMAFLNEMERVSTTHRFDELDQLLAPDATIRLRVNGAQQRWNADEYINSLKSTIDDVRQHQYQTRVKAIDIRDNMATVYLTVKESTLYHPPGETARMLHSLLDEEMQLKKNNGTIQLVAIRGDLTF